VTPTTAAGALLVSSALSLAVAFAIVGYVPQFARDAETLTAERLSTLTAHRAAWRALMGFFMGAVVLTACGLALLAIALAEVGDRVLAPLGLALYAIAAPLFIGALAFQFSVTLWSSGGVDRGPMRPELFHPVERASAAIVGVYMVVAFSSLAVFGAAITIHAVIPSWLGWSAAIFGVAGAISYLIQRPKVGRLVISDLPLWIQVWSLVVGVALLVNG